MSSDAARARTAARLNASHDEDAAGYDAMRRGGWMADRRLGYTLEQVDATGARRVLELGSGTGALLVDVARARPDVQFLGVEPLPNYVEFANARAAEVGATNVTFVEGTGEQLPDAAHGRQQDLLLSTDTLHHVGDQQAVVRSLAEAVRPGGTWVAMEPNRLNPYILAYHVLTPGERTFPVKQFLQDAARAGWSLERRDRLYLIPAAVKAPPSWMVAVERRFERVPVLAGELSLVLRHNS